MIRIVNKKLKICSFLIIIINLIFNFDAKATDQETQLNKLFSELKESKSNILAEEIEQKTKGVVASGGGSVCNVFPIRVPSVPVGHF